MSGRDFRRDPECKQVKRLAVDVAKLVSTRVSRKMRAPDTIGPAMNRDGDQGVPSVPSPALAAGATFRSRYEIVERLGQGGYAEVYRAQDLEIDREVALKILRPDRTSDASVRRLKREAAVARDVESPHLVRVFEVDTSTLPAFLTMEVVEGGSLLEEIAAGPVPIERVLEVARQVLLGLEALHGMGILHRDIKPSNVMITSDGQVKLADFGMVHQLSRESTRLTESSAIVGTIDYVAPETVLGDPPDGRADLYGLGLLLFEMLTGSLPFGDSPSALGAALERLHRSPPRVVPLRPETPRWLEKVVLRLLERRPEDRFASAEAVRRALREHRVPRSRRVWRRNAWLAAGIVLASVASAWVLARIGGSIPVLSHITAQEPEPGLFGLSADGEVLWHRPDLRSGWWVTAQSSSGGGPIPLGLRAGAGPQDLEVLHQLLVLDPTSGETVDRVTLPSAGDEFPGFAPRFQPELHAVDIDGDGGEEVVVTYFHTYWPSYTVVYEPRWRRARVALLAAGHHRPVGVADVDSDGNNELIFLGVSNRMGWYAGLAAVSMVPPINRPGEATLSTAAATTPDGYFLRRWRGMVWYALAPPGIWCSGIGTCTEVDPDAREIRLEPPGGSQVRYSFDGYLVEDRVSGLDSAERNRRRGRAYKHLEEAGRLLDSRLEDWGEEEAERAVELARTVRDRFLTDWALRTLGRIVIERGRIEEGEQIFEQLSVDSPAATSAAFEAAHALQLAGRPDRSLDWYPRAFGAAGDWGPGRSRDRLVRGLLLAYSEIGDYEGAQKALDRFSNPGQITSRIDTYLRPYVAWRMEDRSVAPMPYRAGNPDLEVYWSLEQALAHGTELEVLWERVQLAMDQSSEELPLLQNLAGEIQWKMGRRAEALVWFERAFAGGEAELERSISVRAHFDLIVSRLLRGVRDAGLETRSREIASVAEAWDSHQRQLRHLMSVRGQ